MLTKHISGRLILVGEAHAKCSTCFPLGSDLLAVLCRRHARFLLEHAAHVLRVLKTYLIADVGDRPVGVGK